MRKRKLTFPYIAILTLNSCFFDSAKDNITGEYYINWIDVFEQQFICENLTGSSTSCSIIIEEYVFAVGHNSDFIIVKQHPTNGFEGGHKIDITITNYFIIDMNRKIIEKGDKVIGPLTGNQFDQN